ncbi:hypothetical protein J6590_098916 [Homalodisca vitripennis]|nr:hypothetical protein J6590_098916 [Homalodisca vitripennis]
MLRISFRKAVDVNIISKSVRCAQGFCNSATNGGGGVRGNVYLPPHPAGRPEVTWYRRSVHTVSRLTAIVADRLLSVQSAARRVRGHRISSVASQHAAQVPVCGPPTLRVPVPCQGFRSE